MQQLEDDDELAYTADLPSDGVPSLESSLPLSEGDGRPSWMRLLHTSASTWLQLLPRQLPTLKRTVENIKDPLYRYFEREVNSGAKLLQDVIHDLEDVVLICQVSFIYLFVYLFIVFIYVHIFYLLFSLSLNEKFKI
jgi:dynein heavy chain 1